MSNEIKKRELKELLEAIGLAAEKIIDQGLDRKLSPEQIIADLAIDALEFSIMRQYGTILEPVKNNVIKLNRKDK